jgi:hypothetical protein
MYTPSRSFVLHSWYTYTAAVLALSILAWAMGVPGVLHRAQAVQLVQVSDTLSTSKPGVVANHTIQFQTPTGVPADGSTIELSIPSGFDMSTIGEDDIDIADDGVDLTTDTSCGAVNAAVSTSTQTITIEICNTGGGAIAADSVVTIEIGENATFSGTGAEQIVNHATQGDYQLDIGGTMTDDGATRLVIIDSVVVTGEVETTLVFTIEGVDAGQTVNADTQPTTGTSTATSVPFGTVQPTNEYVVAQGIRVTTNAESGFTVTVEASGELESSTNATIDSFVDGTGTATPTTWAEPSAQSGNSDTYGHWGLTTEDVTLSDDDSFGDALYVGDFIQNAREVMYATSSADGTTTHIGFTRVAYKLEISSLQESSSDYTTQLTYVVTPIF